MIYPLFILTACFAANLADKNLVEGAGLFYYIVVIKLFEEITEWATFGEEGTNPFTWRF